MKKYTFSLEFSGDLVYSNQAYRLLGFLRPKGCFASVLLNCLFTYHGGHICMHSKWVFNHFRFRSEIQKLPLIVLWCLSLSAGIFLCTQSTCDLETLFVSLFAASPSFWCKLLVTTFSIGVAAVGFLLPGTVLYYLAVFLNGISYGFCGCAIYMAQGSAAWLLRMLILFPARFSSLLMWWFILQHRTAKDVSKCIRFVGVLICIAFVVDMFVVSPLLGDITNYF